ncbi:MAG: hypothetical protein JW934_23985 [Anaerolineae bacterium]|nr:hypothetical protein [Anaerolineae bacterium]
MTELRASLLIGAGYRAQRAVQQFACRLADQDLHNTCILPLVLDEAQRDTPSQPTPEGMFRLYLPPPQFDDEAWPPWLPAELIDLPPAQRNRTRAWAKAALHQRADDIHEFLIERIPRLSALDTVSRLRETRPGGQGYTLAAGNEIDIYVLADLTDRLGSSIFIESTCLTGQVCRQLGLVPHTAGLLFLPSATSPAPAEEAMAYAALKELEYANSAGTAGEKLWLAGLGARHSASGSTGPFDTGCYLLDTVNELGYTMQDESHQVDIAAEWLCAMALQGIAPVLQQKLDPRYHTAKLGGKSRHYASLGLAVRYVPTSELAHWTAARLGADVLSRLLDSQPRTEIDRHVGALIERLGLSFEVLEARLRHQNVPNIDTELTPLIRSAPGQLELRTRQALHSIREKHLPRIKHDLERALPAGGDEIKESIAIAVRIILEDVPLGGLNAAREFLQTLRRRIAEQQIAVQTHRQQHSAQLKRSLDTVSTAFYALRTARMRLPPWPVAALWALSAIGIPLFSGTRLACTLCESRPFSSLLALTILFGGTMIVLGLWAAQMRRQLRRVNRQHADLVRERFALESAPLISKTMQTLYASTQTHIDAAEERRVALAEQLNVALERLRADQEQYQQTLIHLAEPGVRQSVIDLQHAEAFYRQFVLDQIPRRRRPLTSQINALALDLVERTGPLSSWQDNEASIEERIQENVSQTSQPTIDEQLAQLKISDLLATDEADAASALESILQEALPWWNFKPALIRRIKMQQIKLVCGAAEQAPGYAISIPGTNPHTLIALTVHRGLPLLALRRIDEYRAHYVDTLQHSKLPLHSTAALVLADDPLTPHRRDQLAPSTLFAAALALGIARRDADGCYLVPHNKQSWIRLSADKSRAVALMSMNDDACREVQKQLVARIDAKGKAAIHAILDEYMAVVPDLDDWQVRGIIDLERARGLELDTDLDA